MFERSEKFGENQKICLRGGENGTQNKSRQLG
jgi:hypothetical protein